MTEIERKVHIVCLRKGVFPSQLRGISLDEVLMQFEVLRKVYGGAQKG